MSRWFIAVLVAIALIAAVAYTLAATNGGNYSPNVPYQTAAPATGAPATGAPATAMPTAPHYP